MLHSRKYIAARMEWCCKSFRLKLLKAFCPQDNQKNSKRGASDGDSSLIWWIVPVSVVNREQLSSFSLTNECLHLTAFLNLVTILNH